MYRKYFFKNKGVLSRKFVASGLAAVFSAGMFGSYAGAMEPGQNLEPLFSMKEEIKLANVSDDNSIRDDDDNAKEVFRFFINLPELSNLKGNLWRNGDTINNRLLKDKDFLIRVYAYLLLYKFYEYKNSKNIEISINDFLEKLKSGSLINHFMGVSILRKDDRTYLLDKIKGGWGKKLFEEVKKEKLEEEKQELISFVLSDPSLASDVKNLKNKKWILKNFFSEDLVNAHFSELKGCVPDLEEILTMYIADFCSICKNFNLEILKQELKKDFSKKLQIWIKSLPEKLELLNLAIEKFKEEEKEEKNEQNDFEKAILHNKSINKNEKEVLEEVKEENEQNNLKIINTNFHIGSINKHEKEKLKKDDEEVNLLIEKKVKILENDEQNNLKIINTNFHIGSINKHEKEKLKKDDEEVNLLIEKKVKILENDEQNNLKIINTNFHIGSINKHELDKNKTIIVVSVVIILLALIVAKKLSGKGNSNTGVPNNNKDDEKVNPSIEPEKDKDDEKVNPSIEPEKDKDDEKVNPSIEPEKDKDDEKVNPSIEPEKDKDDEKVKPPIDPREPSTDPESDEQNPEQNNQEERPSVVLSNILKVAGATVTAGTLAGGTYLFNKVLKSGKPSEVKNSRNVDDKYMYLDSDGNKVTKTEEGRKDNYDNDDKNADNSGTKQLLEDKSTEKTEEGQEEIIEKSALSDDTEATSDEEKNKD